MLKKNGCKGFLFSKWNINC